MKGEYNLKWVVGLLLMFVVIILVIMFWPKLIGLAKAVVSPGTTQLQNAGVNLG